MAGLPLNSKSEIVKSHCTSQGDEANWKYRVWFKGSYSGLGQPLGQLVLTPTKSMCKVQDTHTHISLVPNYAKLDCFFSESPFHAVRYKQNMHWKVFVFVGRT